MKVCVSIDINSSKEEIWDIITDIDNSQKNISAIHKIEIINKPDNGQLRKVNLNPQELLCSFGRSFIFT